MEKNITITESLKANDKPFGLGKNIVITGCGYVGYSIASVLKEKNTVLCVDKDTNKLKRLRRKGFNASTPKRGVYKNCDIVFIALPTDYNEETHTFDTAAIDQAAEVITKENKDCLIVIKSTVPVGYTAALRKKTGNNHIFFSPEFLREGKEIEDMLYPYRIIVGKNAGEEDVAESIAYILSEPCYKRPDVLLMSLAEAEAVKLFSNTYLAMRVAFFNEVDTFAKYNDMRTDRLINGICADARIGSGYNNPSFGYGGYCLPKDTKQLKDQMKSMPASIAKAVVKANKKRKQFIVDHISGTVISKNATVGFYRLTMKAGSDDIRNSASLEVLDLLHEKRPDLEILIYEPELKKNSFVPGTVMKDLKAFCRSSDLIVANRLDEKLSKDSVYADKIYTCDISMTD